MSAIRFKTRSGDEASLAGRERAWFAHLTVEQTVAALELFPRFHDFDTQRRPHLLREVLLPLDHYCHQSWGIEFARSVATGLSVGMVGMKFLTPHGEMDPWYLVLNTALAAGSHPVRLGAWLHSQCELHCWVDGPNRAWLAGIIEEGLRTGLYREGQRWPDVLELLRSADDEPVVTDFSVSEDFPQPNLAGWMDGAPDKWGESGDPKWSLHLDAWHELPREEQWDLCMARLRAEEHDGYGDEITPERLGGGFCFGPEYNGYQLMEYARSCRATKSDPPGG